MNSTQKIVKMNDLKISSTENHEYEVIEELATALRGTHGGLVINGQTKLVLTVASLSCLNKRLYDVDLDETLNNGIGSINSDDFNQIYYDSLTFLHQFFKRVSSLKVIPGSGTVQGCVELKYFTNLKSLELERIPIHLFKGLTHLRSRLQVISCRKCLASLEDLFATCGGDHAVPFPWSDLVAVKLNYNDITSLGDSLRLLSMLKSLDLSHNNICSVEGIEFLNKLEHLNLSYNSLHHFPLQVNSCVSLKFLFLKNNCLDSLRGLECLRNLQELDLSYNCVIDHCNLSPLYSLSDLKKLNLDGNPIAYHLGHRNLTIQHLHDKAISIYTILDGKNLTTSEVKTTKSFNFGRKHIVCDDCFGDFSLRTLRDIPASIRPDDCGSISSFGDFQSSGDFSAGNGQTQSNSKRFKRRTRAAREALIADEPEIAETVSRFNSANVVKPVEVSSNEHLQTKHEIEKCRQEHGKEWLIIGTKLSVLSNSFQPSLDNLLERSVSVEKLTQPDMNDNSPKRSQTSDDVIVLNEESDGSSSPIFEKYCGAAIPFLNNSEPLTTKRNSLSDYYSSEEDDHADSSQPYIVHMKKPNGEEDVILVFSGNDIKEKSQATGRTIDILDLRSLQSFEALPPKIIERDGNSQQVFRIHLTFNHIRKDRRDRVYTIDDEQSYKELCDLIKPVADVNTLKMAVFGAMQCLKCHSYFSKEMVAKVAKYNNRPDDVVILSSSADISRNLPNRVNACPNCFSEMIIEVDADTDLLKLSSDELLSSNRGFALPGPAKLEQITSSCPVNACPDNAEKRFQPIFTSNSLSNSVINFKPNESRASTPLGANGNSSKTKAEIHRTADVSNNDKGQTATSSSGTDGNLQRWESDVTILSNPSQSSIMVLAHQPADCILDAIPEDSDSKRFGTGTDNLGLLGSPTLTKLSTCSSDTLTDSTCQTVEIQTRCSSMQLGQTPESFLSAQSGINRSINANQNVPQEEKSLQNDHHSAKCRLPLLWSNRDSKVLYSFRDFSFVDHRLKLHLNMNILDNDEDIVALLRAGVMIYLKGEEFPGLLVLTYSKAYILKITNEKPFSSNWLQNVDCRPLNSLAHLNVHLGGQAFQFEFGNTLAPSCYIFLLRDDDHCNSFVCFLMDKIKTGMFETEEAKVAVDFDSEEILMVIREQLFTWKSAKEVANIQIDPISPIEDSAESNVYFYVMCYWLPLGTETSFRPISIVVTKTDIFMFSENLTWPVPHLITPSTEALNYPQLIPQIREKIQDLISITKSHSSPFQVMLKFLDEDSGEELDLRLVMETERSLEMLIQSLRNPWEQLFGVELQIMWDK